MGPPSSAWETAARWPPSRSWKARACCLKICRCGCFRYRVNSHDPDEIIRVVGGDLRPPLAASTWKTSKRRSVSTSRKPSKRCSTFRSSTMTSTAPPSFHRRRWPTALELVGKSHGEIRMVISGAGASAISCAELAIRWGVKRENIMLVDTGAWFTKAVPRA
jgi:malate dehydrogenase (oxaloacetate-decarboxylating)(NADP+)